MNTEQFAKCPCQNCGTHLEFPSSAAGTEISCPSCGQSTRLWLPESAGAEIGAAEPEPALGTPEVLAAFEGTCRQSLVSPLYTLGLMLVTAVMVLLPLLYLGLTFLVGYGVYYWAVHAWGLLSMTHFVRLVFVLAVIYVAPLFAGVVLVVFMFKPLFARPAKRPQPLALNPAAEKTLFTFVARICDLVGAPFPQRIDLNAELNAAAGFRRGWRSFFSDDLVLTIGLPLVAGLTTRQLAGVIAHELGHFTQGTAMRLDYIIRHINFWFARVVYQRDAWDDWLGTLGSDDGSNALSFLALIAQGAVGLSRILLRWLMLIGAGVSGFASRQMEYHADAYEIAVAGSDSLEASQRRSAVLAAAMDVANRDLQATWNKNKCLPNDLPAFYLAYAMALPAHVQTVIEDRLGLVRSGAFDTHPSPADRIRNARQAAQPGIIHLDAPATGLFTNFPVASKQVTLLHYSDTLGLPMARLRLFAVEPEAITRAIQSPT